MLAKGRALDQTQTLLYDAAKRGQMSDVLRIIMPFAEAQKEVMGVWAKVGLVDNQAVLRRAQQTLSAARGSGAFYKDPTTGEEMFTFPGSQFLTEHTIGMPIPLTGRVAGLNTFGSGIIPGVGPAVQIPTRYLLPDKPQFDDLHKFLDPFGASAGETEGILEQQFPSWLTSVKRAMSASDSDRTFANAVKDVWAMGVSAGRYRTGTPEEIQEGLDDAKRNARILYVIKGAAALGGAPTPPSPAFMAMDKDGKWHLAKVLSEDYRKMLDDPEIGVDGASEAFLDKYGNNAFAFMQAKTYSTVPSAPSTVDYRAWTGTSEGEAAAKYKDIGALFGPQGEGFDYNSYLRNIKRGDTVNLTPEQFTEQTNNRLATMIYYNQQRQVRSDPVQGAAGLAGRPQGPAPRASSPATALNCPASPRPRRPRTSTSRLSRRRSTTLPSPTTTWPGRPSSTFPPAAPRWRRWKPPGAPVSSRPRARPASGTGYVRFSTSSPTGCRTSPPWPNGSSIGRWSTTKRPRRRCRPRELLAEGQMPGGPGDSRHRHAQERPDESGGTCDRGVVSESGLAEIRGGGGVAVLHPHEDEDGDGGGDPLPPREQVVLVAPGDGGRSHGHEFTVPPRRSC